MGVSTYPQRRIRIAAIDFLNPAPLMWDFEHPPLDGVLARNYRVERTTPSDCAGRLADGRADAGLVPIAALAGNPRLRALPGCAIAAKGKVRSLLLVRRARQPLASLRSVAADVASRTTLVYARMLFHRWGNPDVPFVPLAAGLDPMLAHADAAILIGDPALLALEDRVGRLARTGEELVYHDLAEEWIGLTGVPFVSAVWAIRSAGRASSPVTRSAASQRLAGASSSDQQIAADFVHSRDHGLANIDAIAKEWSTRLPLPAPAIHDYLTRNIHYTLDADCIAGMKAFFSEAAALSILPPYNFAPPSP